MMDEPAVGDHHNGNAEGAEQLHPSSDDACLAGRGLIGAKPCQGLPTDEPKYGRQSPRAPSTARLRAPTIDAPSADAEE
jgi:hypothetical protein